MEWRDKPISQKGREWDGKAGERRIAFVWKKSDVHSNKMLASILKTLKMLPV